MACVNFKSMIYFTIFVLKNWITYAQGLSHSTAGYLTYAGFTQKQAFSYFDPNDVFGCVADIGWITGKQRVRDMFSRISNPPIYEFFSHFFSYFLIKQGRILLLI